MGYDMTFRGHFEFDKKLEPDFEAYLQNFSRTKHVIRDVETYKSANPNWKSVGFEGNLGTNGEYIADEDIYPSIGVIDVNSYPRTCPGVWCRWTVTESILGDKSYLEWNECDQYFDYIGWLKYLINHFIKPKGYTLNGQVMYFGDNEDDVGIITITDNTVETQSIKEMQEELHKLRAIVNCRT